MPIDQTASLHSSPLPDLFGLLRNILRFRFHPFTRCAANGKIGKGTVNKR